MFGKYAYHEIIKRTIIAFGTLFNNIQIRHQDGADNAISLIKVPIAYGPIQKFLSRLDEKPDPRNRVAITLPRMSFEMTGIQYDPSRKVSTIQTFQANKTGTGPIQVYMPAPYNIGIQLSIITKYQDDMLQIIEQILPYFQPAYTLSVDLVDTIGEKRDVPIIFEGIEMRDEYEGDYSQRRALIYTLRFVAKTYLFGPVSDVSKDIIKKTSVGFVAGDSRSTTRDLTYRVDPVATKSYTNNIVTTLVGDINKTVSTIEVANASSISIFNILVIDEENFKVTNKSGNKLAVERSYDKTTAADHVGGSNVNVITSADTPLIKIGDNFGFDGSF